MAKRDNKQLGNRIASFVRQYARKKPRRGGEPNDRRYDRDIQKIVKKLSPEELDRLMREDEDGA